MNEDVRNADRVGVVGLGTMGRGIAQVCIQAGVAVTGHDVSEDRCEAARTSIAHYLGRAVAKGRMAEGERDDALERLALTTELADLAGCDLVIEAIVEDIDAKRAVFGQLAAVVRAEAVLATNTSAIAVTEIARTTPAPERVLGMHFFNPAPLLDLVEIVRTDLTSDVAFESALELTRRIGKEPVPCRDTPGFVVNRVFIPLMNDCVRMLDETGISPDDLDRAMRLGTGWPIGPCALLDMIGLDVHVHASEALWQELREPRMAPPPRLVRMNQAGLLGRKTGRGFYRYDAAGTRVDG